MDEIAKNHHVTLAWDRVVGRLRDEMARRRVHPARTVMLLPYVQLIAVARSAWMRTVDGAGAPAYFMPRFETTMNWAASQAGFVPDPDDVHLDAARDLLTAASLLERAGLRGQHAALAAPLMEAAWSVAALAAAVPPAQRGDWGLRMAAALQGQGVAPALELESRLGRVAVAWAASSAYATDVLFSAQADLLALLEGLHTDPLHAALCAVWADRAVALRLDPAPAPNDVALHCARDPEDEAERAAACVLAHLARGRAPVALVAQDRVLTRRARALLAERGVALRDETGWTLSTTRAAAGVMGLLRAMAWDACTDAVLDWAKSAPAIDGPALVKLETALRRAGIRDWHRWTSDDAATAHIQASRDAMQAARSLSAWLLALRGALQVSGQWTALLQDTAGQAVIEALHLREELRDDFSDVTRRMGQGAFVAWVGQVLEAGSFVPPHPDQAQVVILPMSQLLGRALGAVVLPGCDESRLSASPDLPGMWTASQRVLLGLPSREQLAAMSRQAWSCAIGSDHVDVLWRASESGESRMPAVFVQQLRLQRPALAADPRLQRALDARFSAMPRPSAPALPVTRLSASAYEDLRRCPYRFFALRQLGLSEPDELDLELGKRDFGNWIHMLLRHFHEALAASPGAAASSRPALIDAAAARAARELGLAQNEFLPFAASWPQVRGAYLQWLAGHEAGGARFEAAEAAREMPLGPLTLVGRIDRVDRLGDGSSLVIDYKTESRGVTSGRIKRPQEDTQLAFYAALLADDELSAMYLNIAESDGTRAFVQPDILDWRDRLVTAILDEMARVAQGAALPALGAGSACDYCAARGLCRKDYWTLPGHAAGEPGHG